MGHPPCTASCQGNLAWHCVTLSCHCVTLSCHATVPHGWQADVPLREQQASVKQSTLHTKRHCVSCQVGPLSQLLCMSCSLQGLGGLTLWALALHSSTSMRSSLLLHPSTSMCSLSSTSARPFLRSPILLSMASAGQSQTCSFDVTAHSQQLCCHQPLWRQHKSLRLSGRAASGRRAVCGCAGAAAKHCHSSTSLPHNRC